MGGSSCSFGTNKIRTRISRESVALSWRLLLLDACACVGSYWNVSLKPLDNIEPTGNCRSNFFPCRPPLLAFFLLWFVPCVCLRSHERNAYFVQLWRTINFMDWRFFPPSQLCLLSFSLSAPIDSHQICARSAWYDLDTSRSELFARAMPSGLCSIC